jgi:hypothetical protein
MADYYEAEERNFAAYERLKDEIKQRYAGKYVAIAEGRLVTVSDDFREAWNAVCEHKHFAWLSRGLESADASNAYRPQALTEPVPLSAVRSLRS